MKRQYRQVKLALSIFALACFTPAAAFANPTEIKLNFKYSTNGDLAADVKFDQAVTSKKCIARHRVSLYYEGDTSATIRKSVFNRNVPKGRESTSLRAKRLIGAQKIDGKDPILAIQTRLVCGPDEIDSDVEARFINCNPNDKPLTLKKFLTQLKRELE